MKFSDKLRMLIEERNLTQKQVAIDLNVAASTMGGYVQGSSEPDFDTLIKIAEYFNVSTDYLLNRLSKNTVDQDEEELLRVYRSMKKEYRQIYIEQGKAFLKQTEHTQKYGRHYKMPPVFFYIVYHLTHLSLYIPNAPRMLTTIVMNIIVPTGIDGEKI